MKVLFDLSIYMRSLRGGETGLALLRRLGPAPIWGSSVVLEELYAGADAAGSRLIQKLERDFERARRMLVPTLSDWTQTGRILARVGAKYGCERIGQGRLTHDALIAVSAARAGIEVITGKARDFARLAEFCPLQWRVG